MAAAERRLGELYSVLYCTERSNGMSNFFSLSFEDHLYMHICS